MQHWINQISDADSLPFSKVHFGLHAFFIPLSINPQDIQCDFCFVFDLALVVNLNSTSDSRILRHAYHTLGNIEDAASASSCPTSVQNNIQFGSNLQYSCALQG